MEIKNWLKMYIIFIVLAGLAITFEPQALYTYFAYGLMWFSMGGLIQKMNE